VVSARGFELRRFLYGHAGSLRRLGPCRSSPRWPRRHRRLKEHRGAAAPPSASLPSASPLPLSLVRARLAGRLPEELPCQTLASTFGWIGPSGREGRGRPANHSVRNVGSTLGRPLLWKSMTHVTVFGFSNSIRIIHHAVKARWAALTE
jgi:hypothetical protein